MSRYAIINSSNLVARIFEGFDAYAALQCGEGESAVLCPDHQVVPGEYEHNGTTFVPRTIPLGEAKIGRVLYVVGARKQRQFSTFDWGGSTFDTDTESLTSMQGAVQLAIIATQAGQAFNVVWTLADNTSRVMTRANLVDFWKAYGAYVADLHQTARQLRAQILTATTVAEVNAVVWP